MAITRKLRCKLSDEELRSKGEALAGSVDEKQKKKVEAKNAASIARAAIKSLDEKIRRLTRDYQDRSEERPVECREVVDVRRSQVNTVRQDTGETIESRPMSVEERQGDLPGIGGESDVPQLESRVFGIAARRARLPEVARRERSVGKDGERL